MFTLQSEKNPIKMWIDPAQVEASALAQLKNLANLPFVFKHIAVMPDVHFGKGSTVGSVIATKNAVIPAAVGVDIGCGMMAVKLQMAPERVLEKAREIRRAIERDVPVGFQSNQRLSGDVEKWLGWKTWKDLNAASESTRGTKDLKKTAMSQLGSLGGGNHFIELCTDKEGAIWVMLHSGSRNIGKSLAEIHMAKAKAEMRRLALHLPDPDLAYFVAQTPEYDHYLSDVMWAQNYAFENRQEMMRRVLKCIGRELGEELPLPVEMTVNCHHNYAARENHYGENVLITRKGAVRARKGDLGIIPGSMGTRSYIVEGLGEAEAFESCSHGAGRKMSRTAAKKLFSLEDLKKQTSGVECRKDAAVIDEIPGAYKSIDEVMENQRSLVRVVAELKQFVCVKG